jgi:DNA polymerase III gamma/tau subunit
MFAESYRPRKVADFIGITKAKELMSDLVAYPESSAYLFVGDSGTGKTTMAMAVCEELGAELHHVPSQKCNVDAVEEIRRKCQHFPMSASKFRVILIDEADSMSNAAQDAWLSLLDSTGRPSDTIIIFTCNDTANLKTRFVSRCYKVDFSTHGATKDIAEMLELVWSVEAPPAAPAPNFVRMVGDANKNIRTSLMELEQKIKLARRALRTV